MRPLLSASILLAVFTAGPALAQDKPREKSPEGAKAPASAKAEVKSRTVVGVVKSAQADAIVVSGRETGTKDQSKDRDWAISINDKTVIKRGLNTLAKGDLKAGDQVTVSYTEDGGKVIAQSVTVNDAASGKPPAREVPAATKK